VPYPLRLERIAVAKPWAGSRLPLLVPELPPGTGECIELADLPGQSSIVANGEWRGMSLARLMATHRNDLMGGLADPLPDFPLAVKLIDTAEVLSVQDHPSDAPGRRGKSECWIVLEAAPEAVIYQGLKPGVKPAAFAAALTGGHPLELMNARPLKRGDFLYNKAGMVHAIGAGLTLLEVQQNCGVTYRMWDLPRPVMREMHVEEGLKAAKFELPLPAVRTCEGDDVLATSGPFGVRSIRVAKAFREAKAHQGFTVITCLEGPCEVTARARDNLQPVRLAAGDTVLFPAAFTEFEYYPSGWLVQAWAR